MFNNEEIREICLEDYSRPRHESALCAYYGSEDDIIALMERLKNIAGANVRYGKTIEAVEFYCLDDELTHTIAGQELPVMKPVQEICHFETQLQNQCWNYVTHKGAVLPCYASKIHVCQCLFGTDSGYERCIKASFTDLCVNYHGIGWVNPAFTFQGFPGMVLSDGNRISTSLFVSQAHYEPYELEMATADTVDVSQIDLSVAVADILGEG